MPAIKCATRLAAALILTILLYSPVLVAAAPAETVGPGSLVFLTPPNVPVESSLSASRCETSEASGASTLPMPARAARASQIPKEAM